MAPKTDHLMSLRAGRQLRRVRSFYAGGTLLWSAAAAWTVWAHPGSRQMWVSLFLMATFTALLVAASVWLRSLRSAAEEPLPAHHAAPRRVAVARHARTA
ncbi:hypothetical protein [Streptomyces sp. NPDC002057]|uniref:hypothetical protein n=1 Tax=Streptomyces sp. NPDC002057 TaxID=3154664 RepID=UPI0033326F50